MRGNLFGSYEIVEEFGGFDGGEIQRVMFGVVRMIESRVNGFGSVGRVL